MAALVELEIRIRAIIDENGAIAGLEGEAKYQHSDGAKPGYKQPGTIPITSTLTPGNKSLATWKDQVLALVNAEA